MARNRRCRLEILESRWVLAGDVPTFDNGVFALPETSDDLIEFDIRRVDENVAADDATRLIVFQTDDDRGALESIRSPETYDIKALARSRNRVIYFGDESASYQMRGNRFLSFGIVQDAHLNDWLRARTQLLEEPDIGFLFPVDENGVGDVRALGNQTWEIQWTNDGRDYTYEVQWSSDEFESDLLIESFVNAETADDPPGILVETGDFVARNYAVTNPGNVTLTEVVVTDDNGTPEDASDDFMPNPNETPGGINLGDQDQDGALDPGETWLYTSPHTAGEGQYSSQASVTASANGAELQATDTANYLATNPDVIDLALAEVIADPAPFEAEGGPFYEIGQVYEFHPVVRNAGNVTVAGPFTVGTDYRGVATTVTGGESLAPEQEVELGAVEVNEQEAGSFILNLEVDPDNQFVETDESPASNQLAVELTFVRPDVSVVDLVASPNPLDRSEVGEDPVYDLAQAYELRPVIENTGLIPVSGPFEVRIRYRDQESLVTLQQTLSPGETALLEPIEITENEAGDFIIEFLLDPSDVISESDESEASNRFTESLRFQ